MCIRDRDWVGAVTPMMDLEGRTLHEFVDWVARERGWHVDYGNELFAASASEVMLNGSVEGLALDDVLEAVLPTCGAEYRVDDGILVVEPATGGESGE